MKTFFVTGSKSINRFCSSTILLLSIILSIIGQSCKTIQPGEIGLKVKRGILYEENYIAGKYRKGYNTRFIVFSTRIKEIKLKAVLPTKESIEANVTLTMLYHIKPDQLRNIYLNLGMQYENELIISNLSAIARETCLKYKAMELMSQRDSLEVAIFKNINADIGHYGFVVDQVLIHDIDVPEDIDKAIEKKALSEQQIKQQEVDILTQKKSTDASIEKQRKEMEFVLEKQKREKETSIQQERMQVEFSVEKQKKESERIVIEATAAKKAQDLANSTITPLSIKLKSIEVMKALAESPNEKIIISDGKTLLNLRINEPLK